MTDGCVGQTDVLLQFIQRMQTVRFRLALLLRQRLHRASQDLGLRHSDRASFRPMPRVSARAD